MALARAALTVVAIAGIIGVGLIVAAWIERHDQVGQR